MSRRGRTGRIGIVGHMLIADCSVIWWRGTSVDSSFFVFPWNWIFRKIVCIRIPTFSDLTIINRSLSYLDRNNHSFILAGSPFDSPNPGGIIILLDPTISLPLQKVYYLRLLSIVEFNNNRSY